MSWRHIPTRWALWRSRDHAAPVPLPDVPPDAHLTGESAEVGPGWPVRCGSRVLRSPECPPDGHGPPMVSRPATGCERRSCPGSRPERRDGLTQLVQGVRGLDGHPERPRAHERGEGGQLGRSRCRQDVGGRDAACRQPARRVSRRRRPSVTGPSATSPGDARHASIDTFASRAPLDALAGREDHPGSRYPAVSPQSPASLTPSGLPGQWIR